MRSALVAFCCSIGVSTLAAPVAAQAHLGVGGCAELGCEQRYVTAPNGVALSLREFGVLGAPAILLIHGIGQSHLTWSGQVGPLADRGFRVVTLDYPGHGDSERPRAPEAYNTLDAWADYIHSAVAALETDGACLVGHSLGALLIEDYLFVYGDDAVAGVAAIAGSNRFDVAATPATEAFSRALAMTLDPELGVRIAATRDVVQLLSFRPMTFAQRSIVALYNMEVSRVAVLGIFGYLGAPTPQGYDQRVLSLLGNMPSIFVHGRRDEVIPYERSSLAVQSIEKAGGRAMLIPLRGTGHSPHVEATDAVNRILDRFCGAALGRR